MLVNERAGGNILLTPGAGGGVTISTSLTTGAPAGGTAGAWKVGVYVATPTIPTGYIQVDIGGTLYEIPAKVH
jgi:hypothetical protein